MYSSSYLKSHAVFVAPMTAILKGNREEIKKGSKNALEWDERSNHASEEIKHALLSAIGMQQIAPGQGFVLRTDAPNYAIDAVLERVLDHGRHVPVGFWTRVLAKGHERTWTPRDKEAYANVTAL